MFPSCPGGEEQQQQVHTLLEQGEPGLFPTTKIVAVDKSQKSMKMNS